MANQLPKFVHRFSPIREWSSTLLPLDHSAGVRRGRTLVPLAAVSHGEYHDARLIGRRL